MPIEKVIRGEEGASFARWEPAEVKTPAPKPEPEPVRTMPTVREIEALQKAAYDEGFAQGRAEGLAQGEQEGFAAGQAEAKQLAGRIGGVLQTLAEPLAELDEAVESQIVQLAFLLARQIIRREIQTQAGEVVPVVREALALLPISSRDIKVHLHPEDARFLRENLGPQDEGAWKIVEDASLSRGGCRVTTPTSQIDATLERRLNALASEFLGGIRSGDVEAPV
jgi:flagellar assembly protein FliH